MSAITSIRTALTAEPYAVWRGDIPGKSSGAVHAMEEHIRAALTIAPHAVRRDDVQASNLPLCWKSTAPDASRRCTLVPGSALMVIVPSI